MFLGGHKESFKAHVAANDKNLESLEQLFENEAVKEFWSALKPQQEHTEAHYEVFLNQVAAARLPLEVLHVLKAWQIDIPETWQKTINQASLDEDGKPDFQTITDTLPSVGTRLSELYQETLELKVKVKNTFVFNADGKQGPFGACETRLLPAPDKKPNTNPILVMPGCLTGAISLENAAVAIAQTGYDVVSCDTSSPKMIDNWLYHRKNDTTNWSTPRTAVNTAYTQSVEYAMKTYEEGLNVPPDQKYNLLGYSTSAAAVLQAALLHPEKVDKIVLLAPIGTTNTEDTYLGNILKILVNAARHSKQNVKLGEKSQNAREYFTGYVKRQLFRHPLEVPLIISNAAITDLSEAIFQVVVEKGIPVGVLLGESDELFPAEESVPMLDKVDDKLGDATADTPFEVAVLKDGYTHNHLGRNTNLTALALGATVEHLGRKDRYAEMLKAA